MRDQGLGSLGVAGAAAGSPRFARSSASMREYARRSTRSARRMLRSTKKKMTETTTVGSSDQKTATQ